MEDARTNMTGLQERLTGILIGIARAVAGNEHLISGSTDQIMREGLAAALPGSGLGKDALTALIRRAEDEKRKLIPLCYACASPCGKNNDYDMSGLWALNEDICSMKLLILCGARSISAWVCRAAALGRADHEIDRFLYQALFAVGEESFGVQELLSVSEKFGKIHLRCMALLEK